MEQCCPLDQNPEKREPSLGFEQMNLVFCRRLGAESEELAVT
jgi:hypothetical protein